MTMAMTIINKTTTLQNYIGYNEDENLLIHQLFKRDNLNECYRILFQLTDKYGEHFVWDFIIKVFLDFYAELNPTMERFIFKLKRDWDIQNDEDRDIFVFAYILKNMFIKKLISYNVYNARVCVMTYKYTITKNAKRIATESKMTNLIRVYGNKYSVLLHALECKNIEKIAYKIFTHLKDGDDVDVIHKVIIAYFSSIYFANSASDSSSSDDDESVSPPQPNQQIFEKWLQIKENIKGSFYFNYLITIVIHLFADEIRINKSILFVKPKSSEFGQYYKPNGQYYKPKCIDSGGGCVGIGKINI